MVDKHFAKVFAFDVGEYWQKHRTVAAQLNKKINLNVPRHDLYTNLKKIGYVYIMIVLIKCIKLPGKGSWSNTRSNSKTKPR